MHFNTTYPTMAAPEPGLPTPDQLYTDLSYFSPRRPFSLPSLLDPFPLSDSYAVPPFHETAPSDRSRPYAPATTTQPPSLTDPVTDFLGGKARFLEKIVEEVTGLIYERERMQYEHLRHIDYESTRIRSRLFDIEDWRSGINPGIDKTRSQIERELIGFEREKRMEEVACWRDTTRLRSDLRETLRELDQEQRRDRLISGRAP